MSIKENTTRNRWLIVLAAGAIMGASLGIRHVQGLFLQPVGLTEGWSRESFAFALALQNIIWGLAQPLAGMLADRFGSVRVILLGSILYAVGLLLMAASSTSNMMMLTNGILVGIALSGTAFGAVYGALSKIFDGEHRAWALAVAGALGGLGQFLMVPATQSLIQLMDWRGTAMALGIIMLALAPLAMTLRDTPAKCTYAMGSLHQAPILIVIKQAFAHSGFWLLTFGFAACGFQLAFVATHIPAYLLEHGLTVRQAGATLAIIALTNILGIYFFARAGGIWPAKKVLSWLYLLRAIAMILFISTPVTSWTAYAFSAAMGFLWLGTVPLTNGVLAQIFGVSHIATLFGFAFLGHQLGGFFGVWLGGLFYDTYGSYDVLWLASIIIGLLAACMHWPINDRPLAERPAMGSAP